MLCLCAPAPAFPPVGQVKSLVGEELFSRYDRLLLQSTLDCMSGVCVRPSGGETIKHPEHIQFMTRQSQTKTKTENWKCSQGGHVPVSK